MSHQLDDWSVTNQKQSGRCWMFAGLNLLRVGAAKELGVKDFEFSQAHLQFWDRLEKANFWLEQVISTADRDVDDRTVAHLMSTPAEDGGQWNMFVALVRKHGLVPKSVMPETVSSSSTAQLNRDLSAVLRQAARDLRAAQPKRAPRPTSSPSARRRPWTSCTGCSACTWGRRPRSSGGSGATRTRASTATAR